jgi:hypothetical protein
MSTLIAIVTDPTRGAPRVGSRKSLKVVPFLITPAHLNRTGQLASETERA